MLCQVDLHVPFSPHIILCTINVSWFHLSLILPLLSFLGILCKSTEAISEDEATHVIYCDFMQAFDRVPQKRLLAEFRNYVWNWQGIIAMSKELFDW